MCFRIFLCRKVYHFTSMHTLQRNTTNGVHQIFHETKLTPVVTVNYMGLNVFLTLNPWSPMTWRQWSHTTQAIDHFVTYFEPIGFDYYVGINDPNGGEPGIVGVGTLDIL